MILSLSLAFLAIAGVPAAGTGTPELDRAVVAASAQCLATKHPVEAKRYVLHQYGGNWKADDADFRTLDDKACLSSQASRKDVRTFHGITIDRMKTALAEVLLRNELGQFDAALITNAQPLTTTSIVDDLWKRPEDCKKCDAKQLADLANVRKNMTGRLAPHVFSECVIRTDPLNAHKLLMTDRDSGAEQLAFDALGPSFSQCVAPDQKLSVTKAVLRDFLAYAYYRLANAPRVATASAGASK